MNTPRVFLATLVLLPLAGACGPGPAPRADGLLPVVSNAEIVLMAPTTDDVGPPGADAPSDLVAMNLDGTNRTQLTHDDALEFLPHFSPDGTKVLYTKFETGTYGTQHAVTDAAVYDFATDSEALLTSRGDVMQPVWSPDGSTIAFVVPGAPRSELWLMDADGASPRRIAASTGADDDRIWGDIAWSSDDWILFVVGEQPGGPCFKVRMDKIRPDGTERTRVTDGGPSCTPDGFEQSGDADPGFSADGATIYTSRGLPQPPAGGAAPMTERKLIALSSDPWTPQKVETDLSLPSEPDCIEGVPKGSPDGARILELRACFDRPGFDAGVYVAPADGATRTFVAHGFGADWNPAAP